MKKILFVLAIFVLTNAQAQNNFGNAMQKIVSGNGPVTKAEYDQFWQQLGMNKPEDRKMIVDVMRKSFLLTQEYQKEIWLCAEKAWLLRSIPKCEMAEIKFKLIAADMEKTGQHDALKQMKDSSTRLLKAASKREDFKIKEDAAPLPLTIATMKETRENIERTLNRFEQVLRAEYKEK